MRILCFYLFLTFGTIFGLPLGKKSQRNQHFGIYNGNYTVIAKYPYMASLYTNGDLFGSGVVLNSQWILTTASNVDGFKTSDVSFRVATNMIFNDTFGRVYEAEKIVMHENFTIDLQDYDIAVVKVTKPMKFGKKLSNATLGNSTLTTNTTATVLGWGETNPNVESSQFLQHAKVTVMDWSTCQNNPYEITSRQICTFDKLTGPCMNDYGSPLVVNGTVYALFSWSGDCTPGNSPIVYTDVTQFLDWIQDAITNN